MAGAMKSFSKKVLGHENHSCIVFVATKKYYGKIEKPSALHLTYLVCAAYIKCFEKFVKTTGKYLCWSLFLIKFWPCSVIAV